MKPSTAIEGFALCAWVMKMTEKESSLFANNQTSVDPFSMPDATKTQVIGDPPSKQAGTPSVAVAPASWDSTAAHEVDGEAVGHCDIESMIKDYRIIRTVSETSTSIVYKAEDARTKRRVAIKVIYNRDIPDFDRINRARVEIDRLRHLAHPGLAALLDAGTTREGHCYIVSEFIKGVTLNEYLSIHKLSLDDRLSIFARICEAVHYAHQRCLLHRDLRPSNILIDGKCSPKLVGFGVAGVTDVDIVPVREDFAKRELREFLVYKSPEQVSGRLFDLDVRSDVYTLGVILYELLTDRLPYSCDSQNAGEIVQAVSNEMPPKPSSIKASLRGDLEAIVLKAMEKQPVDRYQNVLALLHDLENYFDRRPVGARRAGAMYEFRKLATRYKSRTISVVIMTLAVLAFGLHIHMTTRQAGHRRVVEVEQQLGTQLALEKTARDIAAREREAAVAALATERAEREAINARMQEVQAQLADFDALRDRLTRRAETAEARADAMQSISRFWAVMLSSPKSGAVKWPGLGEMLEQASSRIERDFSDNPAGRATLLNDLGSLMTAAGDPTRAAAFLNDALSIRSDTLGEANADTIESMNNLASALFATGDTSSAEPVCRRLLAATESAFGADDPRTLTAANNLAMTLYPQKKLSEAETLLQRALAGRREALGADDRRTGATAHSLGLVLFDQGRFDASAEAFREALNCFGEKLPRSHVKVVDTQSRLGASLAASGRFDEAEPYLIDSFDALQAKLGRLHPDVIAARQRIIEMYRTWGKPEKAADFEQ
ncbi:MAG: serine/threonine protein kinase [Phycisphaerae bacterium]|nr:serine/threonine protein kinase [Phycisphaerae bacterium]